MFPILFKFGSITLYTFGLMAALGFFAAIYYTKYEAGREGYDPEMAVDMTFWLMVMGLIGSRVMFILTEHEFYFKNPSEILKIWNGGLVWYGGLLAGTATAWIYTKYKGVRFLDMADILSPAVMLGLAIGRWGCFAAGDDYGIVSLSGSHWWTVTFTNPTCLVPNELLGKPLWPAQLIMSANGFSIFLVMNYLLRRKVFTGQIFFLMMMMYSVNRFLIEYIRGDENRGYVVPGAISTSQFVSLVVFPIAAAGLIYLYSRHRKSS